jgi:GT2 family glycosyltransferase
VPPDPLVSVVVSTFDRPERLTRLLAGLRGQQLGAEEFEVIIVDNGSGPATGAVLELERELGQLQLRTIRHQTTLGPAGGRNSGWRCAQAPLVAFTDDDCVPTPAWLRAGLAAARARPGAIIQGRTEPEPGELGGDLLLSRTVSVSGLGPQYETCNIFYPRQALESLGGFDERFGLRPAGEDTDLAWRALERGYQATFAQDALVHHAVQRLGLIGTLRDATRWGACARLFAVHPQTRAILHRRLFWNVWHFLLLRSALALLAPRWLRRLVLTRHALSLRARGRRAGAGSWSVPFLLLHDAIETAAILRGAVRHRTAVI